MNDETDGREQTVAAASGATETDAGASDTPAAGEAQALPPAASMGPDTFERESLDEARRHAALMAAVDLAKLRGRGDAETLIREAERIEAYLKGGANV